MPRDTGAVMGRLAEELVVPQAYGPVTQQLAADASHSRVVHHIMKSCHPSATYTIISMCAHGRATTTLLTWHDPPGAQAVHQHL